MVVKHLKVGNYVVTFTSPNYETLSAEIEVKSTGVSCIKVTGGSCMSTTPPGVNIPSMWAVFGTLKPTVAPAKGYLSVSSTPSGASVDVNGTNIGLTPVTGYELTSGSKLVTLRLSGYMPKESTVTIIDGQTAELTEPLFAIPSAEEGFLSVTSEPTGAAVSLGGVSVGTTPLTAYGLPEGEKAVSVSLSGYETATEAVTITAGETSTIPVTLSEAVTPTGICGWIDEVGVIALTRDHALYVYALSKGAAGAAEALYAALSPKPSPLPKALASRDRALGIYSYSKGAMGAGNALTNCTY